MQVCSLADTKVPGAFGPLRISPRKRTKCCGAIDVAAGATELFAQRARKNARIFRKSI
jgi:Fe-S oxidoreductase